MKKTVFLILTLMVFGFTMRAQSIKQDTSFFKITNYLWYTSSLLKGLTEEQTIEKRNEIIPKVNKLISCSRTEYEHLKSKYSEDPFLEKVEQWILIEERNMEGLSGEAWKSKPMWQLGNQLIKMALEDLINKGLCN
ncbi:MAG: hypothetical protein K0B37_07440 [Bacteroidales bacterium]|nr:hypothetical protein [Bacteroidales bacterium]